MAIKYENIRKYEESIYKYNGKKNCIDIPCGQKGNGEGSLKMFSIGKALLFFERSLVEGQERVSQFPIIIGEVCLFEDI